jgi:two-component system phosphate regulon sensor histidine kinase PhoR
VPRTITGRLLLASAVTLAVALTTVSLIAPPLAQAFVIGSVRTALPPTDLDALAGRLAGAMLLSAIAAGVVALVVALLVGRMITRPIRELADAARSGSLSALPVLGTTTEIEELSSVLRAASTQAQRLETVRRDLVANVSHELRTPIASLKAMVEALEAGALRDPEAARDFVARMHTEIDDLAQLVSELLELSRSESGEIALRLEPVAPADLVRPSVERLAPLAARSSIDVEVGDMTGLPAVRADRERIGQVLTNLLHNAIKFTPAGGRVEVAAAREDGAVRFSVRDTGMGLRRDEVGRVFERFYKGERSRAGGGTGLGLAVAKHLVQAHGGTITAASEGPGRGSTFSFTLPRAR